MDAVYAVLLGIVEGLTEFLPISSTGHLILAERAFGLDGRTAPWRVLLWVSQFGAILAVVLYFWRELWRRTFTPAQSGWSHHIVSKLLAAMIPTIGLALPLKRHFDPLENNAPAVAAALILGAAAIAYIDAKCRRQVPQELEDVTLRQAFLIGTIQCLSMWPGVSRSGASIMGGMVLGLTPRVSAEFSFYLAIPTMLGAAAYTLWKNRAELTAEVAAIVILGSAVAFVTALVVVAAFMAYVKRYRFTPFVIYRILLGLLVLLTYLWR